MPKVSVIMPVYNAEKYISYAIESILNQNYRNLELIIVDDQGSDDSMSIVHSYRDSRIVVISNDRNMGIAYSRNRAIEVAKGEYIAIMDDDDWTPEYRIGMEVDYLDNHPDIVVVGGAVNVMDESNIVKRRGNREMLHNPNRIRSELMFHDVIPNSSAMFRKKFVEDYCIRYKDNMLGMEDYEFWIQCSLYGNITNLDHVLLHWRNVEGNETSRRQKDSQKEARRAKFKYIQKSALQSNGFKLSEDELEIFCRSFPEENKYISSQEELQDIYEVLRKLIHQAKGRKFEYELKYVCKKMFSWLVQNSTIWIE